jgi:CheY-like chemotaxis protein
MTLEIHDVVPSVVLRAAVDGVGGVAEAKGIEIALNIRADVGTVRGDGGRLLQVFSNLISNAVKFTPAGGRIAVVASREGGGLRVAVTDSGRGIDAALLPYVFEPFRQAEGASRRTHTGLGLGLAIVRHLVDLHGGHADASSPGLGQGSTFTVWLPAEPTGVADARAGLRAGVPAPSEIASLHGVRLLVVEDDADTREVVGLILRECGADVVGVESASAALDVMQSAPPDMLISDIGLADRDGYDLIRSVRQLPGVRGGVPAIALSAFARESDRLEALRAGYDRHVPKPVEPRSLRSAVADLLARSR